MSMCTSARTLLLLPCWRRNLAIFRTVSRLMVPMNSKRPRFSQLTRSWIAPRLPFASVLLVEASSCGGRHRILWSKIAVVHCGLDRAFFDRPILAPPANARLVCVGRLDERKAQILLVAAARRLLEEGTRCEIVLVGDGEMRPIIEEAIRQAGLRRTVTLIGWGSGDRVKAEIEAARALILPSFSENMPVVLMEAMALGRPVISTYIAGIPELVEPGKTGWLVPAGDEVALTQAMREALTAPVAQLAAMGEAARRHILDQHEAFKEAKKLKHLLEQTVTGTGTAREDRVDATVPVTAG